MINFNNVLCHFSTFMNWHHSPIPFSLIFEPDVLSCQIGQMTCSLAITVRSSFLITLFHNMSQTKKINKNKL